MGSKTWIYVIILTVVLAGGGYFFYRVYTAGKVKPKAEAPTAQTFCDVAPADWGFKEIEAVNQAGYMVGYDTLCTPDVDGKKQFKPTDGAVRDQMAAGFSRASGGPGSLTCPPDPYPDVASTNQFCPNIKDLDKDHKAYMLGYEDGSFKPDQIATRTELAITLSRAKALDIENPPATASFADVPVTADNSNHYKEIEAIYKAGYTNGCGTDPVTGKPNYCPNENLSRDQLAVFLYRAYLQVSPPPVSPSPPTSSPTSPSPASPTPAVSPTTTITPPTPTPATPTPAASQAATTTTTTTGTTKTAKTGPEIPLAGGSLLGVLLLVRYLVNRKIK